MERCGTEDIRMKCNAANTVFNEIVVRKLNRCGCLPSFIDLFYTPGGNSLLFTCIFCILYPAFNPCCSFLVWICITGSFIRDHAWWTHIVLYSEDGNSQKTIPCHSDSFRSHSCFEFRTSQSKARNKENYVLFELKDKFRRLSWRTCALCCYV